MWRELVGEHHEEHEFLSPTTAAAIEAACAKIGVELPNELKSLLLESDGVFGLYKLG